MGWLTTNKVSFITVAVLCGLQLVACGEKKKSKKSDPADATTATYSASLILPVSSSTQLTLADENSSRVSITTFDKSGNQTDSSTSPIYKDSDGISYAEINVDPSEITAVEVPGQDLGVLIQATGKKPSSSVQRPMTASGKNVIEAIKAVPPERRPYLDPELVSTVLPAGTKFDASTMKEMVIAFTDKVKELPDDKRQELFLKRMEIGADYKSMVKEKSNLDNALAAEAFAARKVFIAQNPQLADKPVIRILEKPSDVIEGDQNLKGKIPITIREKSSGEALARQLLAKKVTTSDRFIDAAALTEMTDVMVDIKALVNSFGSSSTGTEAQRADRMSAAIRSIATSGEKAQGIADIRNQVKNVLIDSPDLANEFNAKRTELAAQICAMVVSDLFHEKNLECRTAFNSCEATALKNDGFRSRLASDTCSRVECQPFVKGSKVLYNEGLGCRLVFNTCEESRAIKEGWREKTNEDVCSVRTGADASVSSPVDTKTTTSSPDR